MPTTPRPREFGYPRPQLQRRDWMSLNGEWQFAIDRDGVITRPADVTWTGTIVVPFSPETEASGVANTGLYRGCWYQRTFQAPAATGETRLLLHFGAVDYRATIWVNSCQLLTHEGGYTPFEVDITDCVGADGQVTLTVYADDDPSDLAKPRGKQDWCLHPHSIWYPRTTGIWQTVWLERVPRTRITTIRWTPNLERWEIGCAVWIRSAGRHDLRLRVKLTAGDRLLADDSYLVEEGEVHRRIALSDPGIDDYRNELLWNPGRPALIAATLTLVTLSGEVIDEVESYTALRSISTEGDRFILNGRPYNLRLVLEQGYWPNSGMTPPNDDAIRRDIELVKAMGFNGVRKHQKIEDPRYLYWADRLGLLVWEEMPSAYRFTHESIQRATREWLAVLNRDYSHPCIIAWVPFNESWGVPNLPMNPAERNYVRALYHLTKTLDPTRPVIGNDGWESIATDIIGIHDYDHDPARIASRYHADAVRPHLFKSERPGGRRLVLEHEERHHEHPLMLTEFGGIAYAPDARGTWGYSRASSAVQFAERYRALMSVIHSIAAFSGFCYTQFADTYQEANGLLYADRTPKIALEEIAAATSGTMLERAAADPTARDPGAVAPIVRPRRGA